MGVRGHRDAACSAVRITHVGSDIYSFLSICLSVYLSELSTYCSRSRIGRGRDGQGWMGEMGETHISGRGKTCMHVSARRRDGKACLRSKPNFFFFRKGGKGFQVETCVLVNKSVSCRREFALAPGKPSSVQAWTRLGQMPGSRLEVEGRLGRLVCTFQVEHSEVVDYCRAGWLAGRLVCFQRLDGLSRRERCDAAGSS